jgi:hypothetical protein
MLAFLRAALVISTPVSNFILNPETTCSYLFILLKVSIGTHLELLKFKYLNDKRVAGRCVQRFYSIRHFKNLTKTFTLPCAHADVACKLKLCFCVKCSYSINLKPYGTVPPFIGVRVSVYKRTQNHSSNVRTQTEHVS